MCAPSSCNFPSSGATDCWIISLSSLVGNRFVVRISPGKLSLKGDCRSSVKSARDEKLVLTENIVRGHVEEVIGDSLCGMCGKENKVVLVTQGINVQFCIYPTSLGLWVRTKQRADMRERDTNPCKNLDKTNLRIYLMVLSLCDLVNVVSRS